jgi:hypothetical protein
VHEATPTPSPGEVETIFDLGMKAGAATTIELARFYGWADVADDTDRRTEAALSERERAILKSAMNQIIAERTAPDDLSTLGEAHMDGCADPSCDICWGAVQ